MSKSATELSIEGGRILINGRPTYEGTVSEGLLFNVRTVNATFDDTLGQVSWWDDDGSHPENDHAGYGKWQRGTSARENTDRFIAALPQYRECGILAVDLNFQGGHPIHSRSDVPEGEGSAGRRPNGHRDFYHNSGFLPDGRIDEDYAERIADVIDACDRLGMVAILGLFYFGQDTVFENEAGILAAVDSAVDFVSGRGWGNVIIEIANEVMEGHYHHDILKPGCVHELILRAKERRDRHGAGFPVSTSEAALLSEGQWTPEQIDRVFGASDVVLLHGGDGIDHGNVADHTEVAAKIRFMKSCPWHIESPRPLIFNESDGELAFEAALSERVSFGLHSSVHFQNMWPPKWGVWENKTTWFFRKVKGVTSARQRGN